ncbi:MAG: rod shape-determining protein MreD [Verrucomicrobiales bacterium]|nr:rod shape-determining protein MreD [Verrucomicrobiales bacterium]
MNSILIFAAAFLAVFGEAALSAPRNLLGAQVDLLPVLMVYAALNANITIVALLAIFGGLWFDALSANPLGVTILPLFAVGFVILSQREFILHKLSFAQIVLGAVACAVVPALTVLLLLTGGGQPLLGWGSLWQWLVMTAGGAVATPVIFAMFDWCNHALGYKPRTETSFRPDREIHRGRK